jgi:hypothetical protein
MKCDIVKKISTGGENYRFAGKFKKFGRLFERLIQRAEPIELPENKTYFISGQLGKERDASPFFFGFLCHLQLACPVGFVFVSTIAKIK